MLRPGPRRIGFGFGALAPSGGESMSWFSGTVAINASATAANKRLVLCNMAVATANIVVTAPAPTDPINYFGVCFATAPGASGTFVVVVNDHLGAELTRLYVDGDSVWYAYDNTLGAWFAVSREEHPASSDSKLSPVAAWWFDGTSQGTDLSGNGRNLTNGAATVRMSDGVRTSRLTNAQGRTWTRAGDAGLYLQGAMSLEVLFSGAYGNIQANNEFVFHGSGGGGVNNIPYKLRFEATGTSGLTQVLWQQQSGAGVTATLATEALLSFQWQHWLWTRSAAAAGLQTVTCYLNGTQVRQATLTATTGGQAANTLSVGYNNAGQPLFNFQSCSIWNRELAANDARYLAERRLAGRR
jgi:hypothetical protein